MPDWMTRTHAHTRTWGISWAFDLSVLAPSCARNPLRTTTTHECTRAVYIISQNGISESTGTYARRSGCNQIGWIPPQIFSHTGWFRLWLACRGTDPRANTAEEQSYIIRNKKQSMVAPWRLDTWPRLWSSSVSGSDVSVQRGSDLHVEIRQT